MAGLMQKFKEMWAPADDYYDDEYEEQTGKAEDNTYRQKFRDKKSKVVSIHATAKLKVVLSKPDRFCEDIKNAADELLKMHTVVLNLESVIKEDARRILDFLSGAAYAQGGKIKKVSTETYVITPCNVELEGDDVLEELEIRGVCF